MEALILCYRDEPLREFEIGGRPLEIGCGAGCDIVVYDPGVAERHLLVHAKGGTVVVHELAAGASRTLPPREPLAVGRYHSLVRIPDAPTRPRMVCGTTEPILREPSGRAQLTLIAGRGTAARRVVLDGRPLTVGSSASCDLVLDDRSVSGRHCRLESGEDGLRVRDLGSRNGTFVEGVPVTLARVEGGSTIRVGRTDLRLVPQHASLEVAGLVACSPAMHDVIASARRSARFSWPVLIAGESGTGKEGVARAVHELGERQRGPFVAVNAGGMPSSLIESELFGHEKGAFTGAAERRRGVFEQASGGTLFLDEIGELPLDLQARLLRVLETWHIQRLGSEHSIPVDVRLVCATHRDLRQMIELGRFRQDLYFRIAQLVIEVPPLRDRPEDVAPLAEHFLARSAVQVGPRRLTHAATAYLLAHAWPGNVRELRNVLQRAAASCAGALIDLPDVEVALGVVEPVRVGREANAAQLEHVLELHRGNISAAAHALGIARTTLRDRIQSARRKARNR